MSAARALLILLSALALTTAGCEGAGAPSGPSTAVPGQASPQGEMAPSPASPGAQQALVLRAQADSASRAGLPAEQVHVVRVEERQWSDSSLGCPAPGTFYTQVITPGFLIEVEVGGRRFTYHTDRASKLVLCQGGRPA